MATPVRVGLFAALVFTKHVSSLLTRNDSVLWVVSVTFKYCVCRAVSSDSSHHPKETLLAKKPCFSNKSVTSNLHSIMKCIVIAKMTLL